MPTLSNDSAQQLYEKAVAAFEKDDYLKALDLIGQSLKLSPDNKQAQKLKLVIQETLRGEEGAENGSGGASNSRWTFCYGQNTIDSEPTFVHVWHTADGPVDSPSYATMALQLPAHIKEYEVLFSLKFGEAGDMPSGVAVLSGTKVIASIEQAGEMRTLQVEGKQISRRRIDALWHEYSIGWRAGVLSFRCDDREIAHAACKEVPDLLQFGGLSARAGHQQEAFFQWVGLDYNVAP